MKKQNKKLITLLLAGAFCCTAAIGVASLQSVKSFADGTESSSSESTAIGYELTKLFTSDAVVKGKPQATLELGNNKRAGYRNAVALKWFDGALDANGKYAAQYFNLEFAFADANFTTITLSMDTASSIASEAGKATNKIKFVKVSDNATEEAAATSLVLDVTVIADDGAEQVIGDDVSVAVGEKLTLSLSEDGCKYSDEFKVSLVSESNDQLCNGAFFKNVGANYAAYASVKEKEKQPLLFTAETEKVVTEESTDYKKTQISIYSLNGQSFDGVENDKITDDAAPVLVVNEEIKSFMLGAPLSWNETATSDTVPPYMVIDVAKTSIPAADKVVEYYQYNPEDELTDGKPNFAKFDFSYKFMPTVYTPEGAEEETTVYKTEINGETGREFVSIRFSLSDSVNKNVEYYLNWYADEDALETVEGNEYIILNRNQQGAQLAMSSDKPYVKAENGENKYLVIDNANNESYTTEYAGSELEKFVNNYNDLLQTKANDIFAGSNAEMQFPSLEGLFYDDNGYRHLSFTICYKTEAGTQSFVTANSYSQLELDATKVGVYEVKIFATDKSGNKMKFYLNDELVEVSTNNVWDIDAIPTFTYTVKSQGLKVQNEDTQTATARNTTKAIGETYSFSGVTIVGGAEDQQSEFALYRVDMSKWNELKLPAAPAFTSVNYKEIRETIKKDNLLAKVASGEYEDYFAMYLDVYASFLAEDLLVDKAKILSCFVKIEKYNSKITEDDAEWTEYNKYEFGKTSQSSFKVVDDGGVYVMFADYYDANLESFARVTAYKVIKAEEKADVIKGETQWLKNNLVSVILFSVAAVMLVLIVVLLLIKPSDETLEDVDEQVSGKKENKKTTK